MQKSDLEVASRSYWDHVRQVHGGRLLRAMQEYIGEGQFLLDGQSLLQAELAWAGRQPGRLPGPHTAATLVLLVGYSPEPLLQSICAYQPQQILLVLNEKYSSKSSGADFGKELLQAVALLHTKGLLARQPDVLRPDPAMPDAPGVLVKDKPAAVFAALVQALHAARGEVILDITGGKKSMVTGAFLYAALAGATISYVDFEEYDPDARRPYGFTCSIGELDNPYEAFSLRDWERVRTLYQGYRFQEAAALLGGSIAAVFQKSLPVEAQHALQSVLAVLRCYGAWENGDYRLALSLSAHGAPGFTPPTAVTVLGPAWTEASPTQLKIGPAKFYGSPLLPVYIEDELARIRRTIRCSHDYRTGFLRAGSLNEVIMLARLVRMADAADRDALLTALDGKTPGAESVFEQLFTKQPPEQITVGSKRSKDTDLWFAGAPEITIPVNSSLKRWWKGQAIFGDEAEGWRKLIRTRNDLTHKYSSAPAEWAEAAYAFAAGNARDFLPQTGQEETVEPRVWSWETLCKQTGVAQWLPPSLSKGEGNTCDETLPAGR